MNVVEMYELAQTTIGVCGRSLRLARSFVAKHARSIQERMLAIRMGKLP
jgi:hypothetical protein